MPPVDYTNVGIEGMRYAIFVTLPGEAVSVFGSEVAGTVSAERGMSLNGQAVLVAGTKTWPVAARAEHER